MSFAEDPVKFIASEASVSDKIRALDAAGYTRADIARMLGKRYQHVRNVLEADKAKRDGLKASTPSKVAEQTAVTPRNVRVGYMFRLSIGLGGVVVLPSEVMDAFGLHDGGVVVADLDGDRFTLMSPRESLRRARAIVPQWRPGDSLWSDELIADRRREAAKDQAGG